MKRVGAIFSLILTVMLLTSALAYAAPGGNLELIDTYPKDGYENAAIDNFGIKLYFNKDVANKDNEEANAKCFKITDENGENVPTMTVYSDKEEGLVMVLADISGSGTTIKQDTEYTLTVSGDFTAADGEKLGKEETITVRTLNQKKASRMNMLMMVVMMVAIMFFGTRSTKHQEEKKKAEEKVNPYKVAKETGKTVEEVVEEERKKKEKAARKAKREAEIEEELEDLGEDEPEVGNSDAKHVKRARGVKAAESAYVAKRQKELDARLKAERNRGTTNPKKSGSKKRGKKRK